MIISIQSLFFRRIYELTVEARFEKLKFRDAAREKVVIAEFPPNATEEQQDVEFPRATSTWPQPEESHRKDQNDPNPGRKIWKLVEHWDLHSIAAVPAVNVFSGQKIAKSDSGAECKAKNLGKTVLLKLVSFLVVMAT